MRTLRNAWRLLAVLALAALTAVAVAGSSDLVLDALLQRPHRAQGTAIVPDRFLRSWDPVTVFFAAPKGAAGPEDRPERWVQVDPPHPGAWTWLDPRTLQFRPAEPWPPLEVVAVRADGQTAMLSTLLAPPISSEPANGDDGLEPVESISLTFAEPVDPAVLARMTTIEVRALPGLGDGPATRLRSGEFEVKVLDRASADEPARYALVLKTAIPNGRKVVVRLGLSLDEGAREAVAEIGFRTAEPFRPAALGCDKVTLPVAPGGTRHPAERPLRCTGRRGVRVTFTAPIGAVGPIEGRNLVRFEPSVEGLEFRAFGNVLQVDGPFRPDVPYKVALVPAAVSDREGRALEITGPSEVWLYFPRREAYLRWGIGQGIAEVKGPKRVPLEGRGLGTADLRLYRVDPDNRSLWPFPDEPLTVDEARRPPGPGEEAESWEQSSPIPPHLLAERLQQLGSPVWSGIVGLPLAADAGAARFGLDLAPMLAEAGGKDEPGHWLVGLRRLDGGTRRDWVRLQVTDLSLVAVENPTDVWFEVSSLSSGAAVAGATVRVEGEVRRNGATTWQTLYEGRTQADGSLQWKAPGDEPNVTRTVRRIVVEKGADVLVLDPDRPPDRFVRGAWLESHGAWLQWAFQDLDGRGEQARTLVHLFPERPVYKPGDEVQLKGYLRTSHHGRLETSATTGTVIVTGPGTSEWRLPVELTKLGSFHVAWQEDEPPTGAYSASLELPNGARYGSTSFRVEAYRLPTFEVQLEGPQNATTVANDRPFDVGMTASYYAGGRVAARPVRWRVTQYPYAWTPADLPGFAWSSDDRYARGGAFRATPELSIEGTTSGDGRASLSLDPGVEADARPRTYVVEATVTGADDQTVTSTLQLHAVPAFVLGVKVPRFLDRADRVPAELVAMGPDGEPVAGVELSVKLLQRQWHSVLQASDFSDGVAKYVTDVVDVEVSTKTVTSGAAAVSASLPITEAGVYLVEVEARDQLGRAQVVRVDLYAGGDEALSWDKPKAGTFELAADADRHRPGQTAKVLIKSPFQSGEAIVVVEAPDRNRYHRVPVRGGKATFDVVIGQNWVPRVPVHVLVRRGRTDAPRSGDAEADLGKPQSVSSTLWLAVEPVENRVEVTLANPERALPGETVPVTVKLRDPDGRPLAGEVTLWLVDQAVLALGREQRLDPLPDFVVDRGSFAEIRDTRNLALGVVPTEEMPGGDGGEEEGDLLDRATVRKDFKAVAFYDPRLMVPASGEVTVQVKLPDNLTVFKLRAKAISGEQRFGFGAGQIAVRLPVVVQPALPRFVRPGDRFEAAALARVVEGDGGAGEAQIRVEGLTLAGADEAAIALDASLATRLAWPVSVTTPPVGESGELAYDEVVVRIAASRTADGASDAVEARLPLRDDRGARYERVLLDLAAGGSAEVPALTEEAREHSVRRSVVVAGHPGLVRMASALDVLRRSPGNGTDAVLARARVAVGLGSLRGPLGLESDREQRELVEEAQAWLPTALDGQGLVSGWPGGRGTVSLTADALAFLAEAREAGYAPDERLVAALERALTAGLRSDYAYFLDGESWAERTNALWGLTVGGRFDEAYFTELSRNARALAPESKARVLIAAARGGQLKSPAAADLALRVSGEVVVELYQGKQRYAGLKSRRTDRTPFVYPSEARELATLLDALQRARPEDTKLPLVEDALVRLGRDDGWGQPNADAAALLALGNRLASSSGEGAVELTEGSRSATLTVKAGAPVTRHTSTFAGPSVLKHAGGDPLAAVAVTRWIPAADGAQQAPEQRGFVVEREWMVVRASGPPDRTPVAAGGKLAVRVGDVIEEHVRVVNPDDRFAVVVTVPLAAGLEPLNPALATAPPEARPANRTTAAPTWTSFGDDRVLYAFDQLPKGTFDFYFRTRAAVAGSFVQPAASAEMVYDRAVSGLSAGSRVEVAPGE